MAPSGEEAPAATPPVPEEEQAASLSPTPEPALPSTLPALAPSAPSPEAPQLSQAPSGFHQLHIQARERTWIRVVIDEELVQDVVLEPNEQVRWEARDNFTLTVGNAGGVEVTFDDDRLSPAGTVWRSDPSAPSAGVRGRVATKHQAEARPAGFFRNSENS